MVIDTDSSFIWAAHMTLQKIKQSALFVITIFSYVYFEYHQKGTW